MDKIEDKLNEARVLWKTKIEEGWKPADDAPWMICEKCGSDHIYFMKKDKQLRYVCSECATWSDAVKYSKRRSVRPDQRYFRDSVLRMYNSRCVLCGQFADEAHHIIPVSAGNDLGLPDYWIWSISNGVALCRKCHAKWHEANYEVERKLHFARNKRGE